MQVGPDDDNYSWLRSQPTYPVRFDHDHDDGESDDADEHDEYIMKHGLHDEYEQCCGYSSSWIIYRRPNIWTEGQRGLRNIQKANHVRISSQTFLWNISETWALLIDQYIPFRKADWWFLCPLWRLHPHPAHPHRRQQLRSVLQEQALAEWGHHHHDHDHRDHGHHDHHDHHDHDHDHHFKPGWAQEERAYQANCGGSENCSEVLPHSGPIMLKKMTEMMILMIMSMTITMILIMMLMIGTNCTMHRRWWTRLEYLSNQSLQAEPPPGWPPLADQLYHDHDYHDYYHVYNHDQNHYQSLLQDDHHLLIIIMIIIIIIKISSSWLSR